MYGCNNGKYCRQWSIVKRCSCLFEKSRIYSQSIRKEGKQKDVIDKLSEKTGLYKKDIKAMLVALNELVYEEMDNDNAIILNNLLKIEPVTIASRNRYDIVRNKVYQHEAYQVVKITPSNNLRDSVRKQNTKNEDE